MEEVNLTTDDYLTIALYAASRHPVDVAQQVTGYLV
jgi:hypothetical protein